MTSLEREIKCVVVGDGIVGKTCLLSSFLFNEFPQDTFPETLENCKASVMHKDTPVVLSLFDTQGQEDYERLRPLSYPNSDVFLVCFSLSCEDGLKNIEQKWLPELRNFSPATPLVLVGLKKDLRDNRDALVILEHLDREPVSSGKGREMAKKIKAFKYIECSAVTGENVKKVFDVAVAAAMSPKTPEKCNIL